MEQPAAMEARWSREENAKLRVMGALATRGNQTYQDDDDDDDGGGEQDSYGLAPEEASESDGADAVERFIASSPSSASSGSIMSPTSTSRSGSVATPPSTPGKGDAATPEEAEHEQEEGEGEEQNCVDMDDSLGDETDGSIGPGLLDEISKPQQETQKQQLQNDIEVLAAHLQVQTLELERERGVSQSLQRQLEVERATMERELENVLIENDALRHQNALLSGQCDERTQREQAATEAQDELLRALKTQQQRESHARTIIAALVKERDVLKRQVDESKSYCRRLEEDALTLRAEQQHLRAENKTLHTAVTASAKLRNDDELKIIHQQEQMIQSLRADVVQMEFEFKTVSLDKEKLNHRVATLQRQSESPSTSYDVISLRGDGAGKANAGKKKRLSITTTGGGSAATRDSAAMGFTNLMTLPNCVDEAGSSASAVNAVRPRTPMGSLVSKTLSSAKKKLFQSSSSHATTVVLPQ